MNTHQKIVYDNYTAAPPANEGNGAKHAYHVGFTGGVCRWPKDSLAFAGWKAGFDRRHKDAPRSTRKPHNDAAGYVCERKSSHPKLPGHFVVLDRDNGGDWIDSEHRWIVVHMNGKQCGCIVTVLDKNKRRLPYETHGHWQE